MKIRRRGALGRVVVALLAALAMTAAIVSPSSLKNAAAAGSTSTTLAPSDYQSLESFWSQQLSPGKYLKEVRDPILQKQVVAKAQPDECFYGIGDPRNGPIPPEGCGLDGQTKVNQAYVWGLTKLGTKLWWGTAPNVHCLVLSGYLGLTTPNVNDSWACEFGASKYASTYGAALGDFRPPRIYSYDTATKQQVDRTPGDPRLATTLGLRSAGSLANVVLLGGPSVLGGVNFFAFRADTGQYLGSTNVADFTNIRKWIVADGHLYTGVGSKTAGGLILRWDGNITTPFVFTPVGSTQSEVSELAVHNGRLFVTTWPGASTAGLYEGPPITDLATATTATAFTKIWSASDYDPDPVSAMTYGGGALASFGGYLFWGTMHVPFTAMLAHEQVYGFPQGDATEVQAQLVADMLGSNRAISIFRLGGDHGAYTQEVAYGTARLPVYLGTPVAPGQPRAAGGQWALVPNKMGAPLFGPSGFGNLFNNYTWTMDVYNGRLYIGTMDWSMLLAKALPLLVSAIGGVDITTVTDPASPVSVAIAQLTGEWAETFWGADLFRMDSATTPGKFESMNGVGNYSNYGIRTMLVDSQDGVMYLGTANPMNLMTNPFDDKPQGGWELLRMRPHPTAPDGKNAKPPKG